MLALVAKSQNDDVFVWRGLSFWVRDQLSRWFEVKVLGSMLGNWAIICSAFLRFILSPPNQCFVCFYIVYPGNKSLNHTSQHCVHRDISALVMCEMISDSVEKCVEEEPSEGSSSRRRTTQMGTAILTITTKSSSTSQSSSMSSISTVSTAAKEDSLDAISMFSCCDDLLSIKDATLTAAIQHVLTVEKRHQHRGSIRLSNRQPNCTATIVFDNDTMVFFPTEQK